MVKILSFTFNPFSENTYILFDESNRCVIIDPGCSNSAEENTLLASIKQYNLIPEVLFNTHCHIDHVLGNAFVHKHFDLSPIYHPLEHENLIVGEMVAKMYGIPYQISPFGKEYIDENKLLVFGNSALKLLFTPGHSAGSLSIYAKEENFIVSGDVLFNGSIGRTDLPGGDLAILEKSIKTQLYSLPENTVVYSGHGEPTTVGKEKKTNPYVKL